MKHFEASGQWSLVDDSSNVVGGMLIFDNEGLNLKLLGSFSAEWPSGLERYPIIHGVVAKNPYGTYVTLIDCIRKNAVFNMAGVTSETIRCSRAIIGASHLADQRVMFNSMEVVFSFLKDWAGLNGITFEVSKGPTYSVKYASPERKTFGYGDKMVSVASSVSAKHGKYNADLNEEALVLIEPVGERLPTELGGHDIHILQNLLTFATDRPNAIEHITYYMDDDDNGLPSSYHLVFEPIFRPTEDKEMLHLHDMLFTLQDTQAQGLNIFQRWLEFTDRNQGFCTIFFANLYAEPRYLNDRFASLMLAFTLLTRAMGEVSEQTKLFDEDINAAVNERFNEVERERLRHIVPTRAEIEMPYRLEHLLQENAGLVGTAVNEIPEFVKTVCEALAYFKRRDDAGVVPMNGKELLHTMLKVQLLIKIVILKELGFEDEVRNTVVRRNTKNNYIRIAEWKEVS